MTVSINGTSGLTFNDASTQNTAATGFGFKNRIINGAMVIDQRNAGASVGTAGAAGGYSVDRWQNIYTQVSKFTVQQDAGAVTPPTGFIDYLGVTSSSAYSVLTGDTFVIQQPVEGFNTSDLGFGTANASSVTLSFWVRSSLTGTFGGALANSAGTRSYPFSYTISAANTWEQKTVTIAGDTTGTWLTNNGIGILVRFGLGSGSTFSGTAGAWAAGNIVQPTGSVSVVGTNGATFYITGVQLEKGSTATSFDYRPYGTELQLAQRYCFVWSSVNSVYKQLPLSIADTANRAESWYYYPVQMRSSPTVTFSAASNFRATTGTSNINATAISSAQADQDAVRILATTASGISAGNVTTVSANNSSSATITISAEL